MSETTLTKLSWALVGLIGISAVALFGGWIPAGASSDHEVAKALRQGRHYPSTE
jgi:hypothetical protein